MNLIKSEWENESSNDTRRVRTQITSKLDNSKLAARIAQKQSRSRRVTVMRSRCAAWVRQRRTASSKWTRVSFPLSLHNLSNCDVILSQFLFLRATFLYAIQMSRIRTVHLSSSHCPHRIFSMLSWIVILFRCTAWSHGLREQKMTLVINWGSNSKVG